MWSFEPGDTPQIGRASNCDVVVNHGRISRVHSTCVHEEGRWYYASFGTNGSFVDGVYVDRLPIDDGTVIELGGSGIFLHCNLVSEDDLSGDSGCNSSETKQSITGLLSGFAAGDEDSTRELWARCFASVVRLARQNLSGAPRRMTDEEDVAASVFESLFFGAVEGKFPDLKDRDSLWRLIVVMTRRKAADHVNSERREKRGGGNVRGDSIFLSRPGAEHRGNFDHFVGTQPSPIAVALVEEKTSELLDALPDEEHRQIVLLRLEGYSTAETADELSISLRSVERRLQAIRTLWSQILQLARAADDEE